MHPSEPSDANRPRIDASKGDAPSASDYVPGLYIVCTGGLIAGVVVLLSWLSGDGWLPWREAETPLIVSLRDTFEAAASEAGVPVERDRCRSLSKYLADGKYLMHYTCLVAETSRPALLAALVKRGFEPEANLNGRLFGLRRGSQTASLYCRFGEKFCELRFEHVPTH